MSLLVDFKHSSTWHLHQRCGVNTKSEYYLNSVILNKLWLQFYLIRFLGIKLKKKLR